MNKLWQKLGTVPSTVALQSEGLVDLHVAALEVEFGVHAKPLLGRGQVHPGLDPLKLLVAQVTILGAVTRPANVVYVLARLYGRRKSTRQKGLQETSVLTNDGAHELAVAV